MRSPTALVEVLCCVNSIARVKVVMSTGQLPPNDSSGICSLPRRDGRTGVAGTHSACEILLPRLFFFSLSSLFRNLTISVWIYDEGTASAQRCDVMSCYRVRIDFETKTARSVNRLQRTGSCVFASFISGPHKRSSPVAVHAAEDSGAMAMMEWRFRRDFRRLDLP